MNERPDNRSDELEPTIVPVRRPDAAVAPSRAGRGGHVGGGDGHRGGDGSGVGGSGGRPRRSLAVAAILILLTAAGGVFVWLPGWVEQQRAAPAPADAPASADPVVAEPEPELSAEALAALRDRAAALLAEQLEQEQALDRLSAASWGDTTWSSYVSAARAATDAFADENLPLAVSRYEEALAIGEQLEERSRAIVREALAAGAEAIDSGNADVAASQYALVLSIEPGNAEALRGEARAAALGEVLAAMRRGDEAEAAGRLEDAAAAYREALALDGAWTAARTALDAVNARIAAARHERLLAEGYAAVAEERFELAIERFDEALAMRPDSVSAQDGLAQAEQGLALAEIEMAEVRGTAFERTERWDQAIARYREALAVDPTLAFAIEGLDRAQRRADLAAKLQVLIDSPRRLLTEDVLADGRRVLEEALAIEEPGPRHREQVERVQLLIELASTPIPVRIESDGLTEVIVYRIGERGELGSFTQTELELLPGSYTAVGQRRGYRDVRESFMVLPGADPAPVRIVCTEAI